MIRLKGQRASCDGEKNRQLSNPGRVPEPLPDKTNRLDPGPRSTKDLGFSVVMGDEILELLEKLCGQDPQHPGEALLAGDAQDGEYQSLCREAALLVVLQKLFCRVLRVSHGFVLLSRVRFYLRFLAADTDESTC